MRGNGFRVEQVMGMPIGIDIRGVSLGDADSTDSLLDRCFESLREADDLMSLWRPGTPLARLSDGRAALAEMPVEVVEVLRLSVVARRDTAGHFAARRPDGRLDPTGLVKGWALARVGDILLRGGARHWCVNGAGDVVVRGDALDSGLGAEAADDTGAGWTVGIADPTDPQRLLTSIRVRDAAVATSGSAQRGAHIWSPVTERAASGVSAVTVVCADIVRADVLATAAVARGRTSLAWLDSLDGVEALVVGDDGTVGVTTGWPMAAGDPVGVGTMGG